MSRDIPSIKKTYTQISRDIHPDIKRHTTYQETHPLSRNIPPIKRHTPLSSDIHPDIRRHVHPIKKHTPGYQNTYIPHIQRHTPYQETHTPILVNRHTPLYQKTYPLSRDIPPIKRHTRYQETYPLSRDRQKCCGIVTLKSPGIKLRKCILQWVRNSEMNSH